MRSIIASSSYSFLARKKLRTPLKSWQNFRFKYVRWGSMRWKLTDWHQKVSLFFFMYHPLVQFSWFEFKWVWQENSILDLKIDWLAKWWKTWTNLGDQTRYLKVLSGASKLQLWPETHLESRGKESLNPSYIFETRILSAFQRCA